MTFNDIFVPLIVTSNIKLFIFDSLYGHGNTGKDTTTMNQHGQVIYFPI